MNFWPSWKYQMDGMKWSLIVFYGVIAALLVLMGISMTIVTREHNQFSVGGLEMASIIFIFVTGLNSFKTTFHMLSANSISRKTMFVSYLAVIGIVAAGMAVIDTLYGAAMKMLGSYQSMFEQIYGLETGTPALVAGGFEWRLCSYLVAGMMGYFITTLYYRMNKGGQAAGVHRRAGTGAVRMAGGGLHSLERRRHKSRRIADCMGFRPLGGQPIYRRDFAISC